MVWIHPSNKSNRRYTMHGYWKVFGWTRISGNWLALHAHASNMLVHVLILWCVWGRISLDLNTHAARVKKFEFSPQHEPSTGITFNDSFYSFEAFAFHQKFSRVGRPCEHNNIFYDFQSGWAFCDFTPKYSWLQEMRRHTKIANSLTNITQICIIDHMPMWGFRVSNIRIWKC